MIKLTRRNFIKETTLSIILMFYSLHANSKGKKIITPLMTLNKIREIFSQGGHIYISNGIYNLGRIKIQSNCTITGAGQLQFQNNEWHGQGSLIIGEIDCSDAVNFIIKDLTIDNYRSNGNALSGTTPRTGNCLINNVTTRANNHGQLWEANDDNPENKNSIGNIIVRNCIHYHGPNGFVSKHKNVCFINCIAHDVNVQAFVIASDNINPNNKYSRAIGTKIISCRVENKNNTIPPANGLRIYSRMYDDDFNVKGLADATINDFYASGNITNIIFIGDYILNNQAGGKKYSSIESRNIKIMNTKKITHRNIKISHCENLIIIGCNRTIEIEKCFNIQNIEII
ncbi:hypothetical protein QCH01_16785 [Raoultella ornithinolytica]|uniref:hypothetical protein n=1 Tax=Raoultella ornithinolytica TaxID=54291 RepID=UPI001F21DF18|nr:hypothetical protein [Raoultella ornithinolytica]UIZ73217.1 hypothetical protein HRV96_07995 [Raoultella ornithinolytica]